MQRVFAGVALLAVLTVTQAVAGAYPQAYRWERTWGAQGSSNGLFNQPFSLCIDGKKIYVADRNNHRVQVFWLTGGHVLTFGVGQLSSPWGVAVDGSHNVYVSSSGNDKICKFNSAGTFLDEAGSGGSGNGQFSTPTGVAYSATQSRVVLCDRFNARLSLWNLALVFQNNFKPTGARALNEPGGLVFDSNNNLYIADTSNHRIEKYNSLGTYERTINVGGTLTYPYNVAVDAADNLYIADTLNNRLVKTKPNGTVLAVMSNATTHYPWNFGVPRGVAVDADGHVYFTDGNNHRIIRLARNHKPSPPAGVTLKPAAPTDSSNLTANATGATDPDDDPLTYSYRWYRRNSTSSPWVLTSHKQKVLPASMTSVGQSWKAQGRAYDGDNYGDWKTSPVRTIGADPAPALGVRLAAATTPAGAALTVNLQSEAQVQVSVLNLAGRTIAVLPARTLPAGVSTVLWNGRTTSGTLAPQGHYLVKVTAGGADGTLVSATANLVR